MLTMAHTMNKIIFMTSFFKIKYDLSKMIFDKYKTISNAGMTTCSNFAIVPAQLYTSYVRKAVAASWQ